VPEGQLSPTRGIGFWAVVLVGVGAYFFRPSMNALTARRWSSVPAVWIMFPASLSKLSSKS
jgi:hypothetical protein